MKRNRWTIGLIGAGLVSLPAVMHAEERTNAVLSALSATTLSGYVDTSAQWNMGTGDKFTPAYSFSSGKADGFNLNLVKLTLEKAVEATDVWGAGFKTDLIFGPDATLLNTVSPLSSGTSDFGVKQAYVALHAPVGNGLDFKMGVWDTIIGYESTEGPNNPNWTRSYGYTLEPSTHLGIQGTYVFCEAFSATVGVANTFGPSINQRAFPARAESFKTYLGAMTMTAPSTWGVLAGSTLTAGVINGYNAGLGVDETSLYAGATLNTPVTGFKVGASYDYLGVSKQALGGSAYANAVAVYASYQLTEKATIYGRGEYATSDIEVASGLTTSGFIPVLGAPKVVAATATFQYDLWKNVLSRVEFRWDHAASGGPAYGGTPGTTDQPTKKNSFILAANIVYRF